MSIRSLAALIGVLALFAAVPASASAAPEDAVAGVNKKWFSGSLMQTSGTNCSILGGAFSETMVSAIGSYGGSPSGSLVKVGDSYWADVLISIPGNPCGSGSTIVATDLSMPPGTSYDNTRQIRCFGVPRNSNAWSELTGGYWDLRPIGINAYGPYCPTSATPSSTGNGIGFGYRALASGQMYQLFIPVKSTQTLIGAGSSPAHEFRWTVSATGTYNTDSTYVWANVFSAGAPTTPYIYFARDPSVVPFWNNTAAAGTQNQVELFANLYSAFNAGTFCWDVFNGPNTSGSLNINCEALGGAWGSAVNTGSDAWLVQGPGPNGGAVPFYFDAPEYGHVFTIRWRFAYSGGTVYSTPVTFTALAGPDEDGDGIPNNGTDQCPTVKGNLPNGCQPSLALIDPDGDGLIGANDKCPTASAPSTSDGCPLVGPAIGGAFGKLPKFKRKSLVKGTKFPIKCAVDATVSADLTVDKATAKKLKIKLKKGAKTASIGTAKGSCTAAGGGKLKLKLGSKTKKAVLKPKKAVKATLIVYFTRSGSVSTSAKKSISLG